MTLASSGRRPRPAGTSTDIDPRDVRRHDRPARRGGADTGPLVDLAGAERNIARMAAALESLPAAIRPHIKVHKSRRAGHQAGGRWSHRAVGGHGLGGGRPGLGGTGQPLGRQHGRAPREDPRAGGAGTRPARARGHRRGRQCCRPVGGGRGGGLATRGADRGGHRHGPGRRRRRRRSDRARQAGTWLWTTCVSRASPATKATAPSSSTRICSSSSSARRWTCSFRSRTAGHAGHADARSARPEVPSPGSSRPSVPASPRSRPAATSSWTTSTAKG